MAPPRLPCAPLALSRSLAAAPQPAGRYTAPQPALPAAPQVFSQPDVRRRVCSGAVQRVCALVPAVDHPAPRVAREPRGRAGGRIPGLCREVGCAPAGRASGVALPRRPRRGARRQSSGRARHCPLPDPLTHAFIHLFAFFTLFISALSRCPARYTSKVTLRSPSLVRSRAERSALFQHLYFEWELRPGPTPGTTWVAFEVDFAFRSRLYHQLAGVFLEEASTAVVLRCAALWWCRRARGRVGGRSRCGGDGQ
jgi:hypothetical protein